MSKSPRAKGVNRSEPPRRSPNQLRIGEILIWGLAVGGPEPEGDPAARRAWKYQRFMTRTLEPYWAPLTADELNAFRADQYRKSRSAQGFRGNRKGSAPAPSAGMHKKRGIPTAKAASVKHSTVTKELEFLRALRNRFVAAHDLQWPPANLGKLKSRRGKPAKPLTRSDLAALLWATRGCVLRSEVDRRGSALRPANFGPPTDGRSLRKLKRARRHIGRLILLAYYTGSGGDCASRLRWEGDPRGEESFVDLETGQLYRLGPDAAPGKQAGMGVSICPRLMFHLLRWHAIDEREGHERIVHAFNFRNMATGSSGGFSRVCVDAAAPEHVTLKMLGEATAAELMRKGVSIRSAAIFLGKDTEIVTRRYSEHRDDFHENAREALQRRPKSVRTIPPTSAAWRSGQAERPIEETGDDADEQSA